MVPSVVESGLKESTKKVQSLKEDLQDCRIRFVELADQGEKCTEYITSLCSFVMLDS